MSFTGAFNPAPFNRKYIAYPYFTVSISSLSEVAARLNADVAVAVVYDVKSQLDAPLIREILHSAVI